MQRRTVWLWGWWAVLAAVATGPLAAAEPTERWESAVQAFEAAAAKEPPPVGANLFVGSSSVRLWKLGESFPEFPCINRGFGGSQLADVARYADRLVLPARPQVVVLYAGDNDVAKGRTPEQIRDDYRTFVGRVQCGLPEARIVWVSIKPSPARWQLRDAAQRANALVREVIEAGARQAYVDVWTPMLNDAGEPRPELFVKDQLHMSAEGYALWAERVRPHLVSGTK